MSAPDDARRADAMLEHNVARLVREAYVPARPAPAFRAELSVVARGEARRLYASGDAGVRPHRSRWLLLAAALLVAVGAAIRLTPERPTFRGTAWDALTAGRPVLSRDGGTSWYAPAPAPGAGAALEVGAAGMLLVTTPQSAADAMFVLHADLLDTGVDVGAWARAPHTKLVLARSGQLPADDAQGWLRQQLEAWRSDPDRSTELGDGSFVTPSPAPSALAVAVRVGPASSVRLGAPRRADDDGLLLATEVLAGSVELPASRGVLVRREHVLPYETDGGRLRVARDHDGLRLRALGGAVRLVPIGTSPARTLAPGEVATWDGTELHGGRPADIASATPSAPDERRAVDAPVDGGPVAPTGGADADPALVLHVLDDATGEPVRSVTLGLVPERRRNEVDPTRRWSSEAEDGRHALPERPAGTFTPVVHADGYALWTGAPLALPQGATRALDVALVRGGRVRGHVVDAASGNGLAGVVVTPRGDTPLASVPWDLRAPEPWLPAGAETAADGGFVLPHVSPGTHTLHVAAPGYAPRLVEGVVVAPDGEVELEPLPLSPEAVLAGTVRAAGGAPSPGERLVVAPFSAGGDGLEFYALAETDADGRYRFGTLPTGMHLAILVPAREREAPIVRPVRLDAGATTTLDLERAPSGARVIGTLRAADDTPVAQRNLALIRADGGVAGATEGFHASSTDADGGFRFDGLEPGPYELMVVGEPEGTIVVVDALDVRAPEVRLDATLGRGRATGSVERAVDGVPVGGATVVLMAIGQQGPRFVAEARTDAAGRWSVQGLRPAALFALAYPGVAQRDRATTLGFARSQSVVLGDGDAEVDLGAVALPAGGALALEVVDADGRARPGARVRVARADGTFASPEPVAVADADGALWLGGLAPGTYTAAPLEPHGEPLELGVEAGAVTRATLTVR